MIAWLALRQLGNRLGLVGKCSDDCVARLEVLIELSLIDTSLVRTSWFLDTVTFDRPAHRNLVGPIAERSDGLRLWGLVWLTQCFECVREVGVVRVATLLGLARLLGQLEVDRPGKSASKD